MRRFHHPAVPIVLMILLLDSIGFGIVLPVLPGLIVHLGHVSLTEATRIAGYMLVAYAAAQFFAGPILGNLGDKFGRRPILLFCVIGFGIDYLLMAAAPTLAWLFVGRIIAGIAGATYGPANAVLADVTPPEKRGATFGLMGAAFGLAVAHLLRDGGRRARDFEPVDVEGHVKDRVLVHEEDVAGRNVPAECAAAVHGLPNSGFEIEGLDRGALAHDRLDRAGLHPVRHGRCLRR